MPTRERPARLLARHIHGYVKGPDVVRVLRAFQRQLGKKLTILWDRLQAHRSKEVAAYLRTHARDIRIEWLPPYAPDLNAEEQCNAVVKAEMRNNLPENAEDLRRMARRSFDRLRRRKKTLSAFFRHAGLLHRTP
jgi:transposase